MSAVDCTLLAARIRNLLPNPASIADASETAVVNQAYSIDPDRAQWYVARRLELVLQHLQEVGPKRASGAQHDARIALGAWDELRRLCGTGVAA
jgi:hypothetical protein